MTVEGMVRHMEVANFMNTGIDALDSGLLVCNNVKNQSALVQHVQDKVLGSLPSSDSYDPVSDSDSLFGLIASDFPLGNNDCLLKVTLFSTSGSTDCKFSLPSSSSDGSLTGPRSFSLNLPPFTFWVIFTVLSMFVNLLKDVGKSVEELSETKETIPKALDKKCESSRLDVKGGSGAFSTTDRLSGDISISCARVILCFPFERGASHATFSSWKHFIALDFTSSLPLKKGCPPDGKPTSNVSLTKRFPSVSANSVLLNVSDFNIYLVTPTSIGCSSISSCNVLNDKFSASCLLSVTSRIGCSSAINVVWQEGPVTGPWIAKKARFLANSVQFRGRDDSVGRGYEFASASTVKDMEDLKSQTQEEMILSSSVFIHVHLSQVMVNLSDSQYKDVNRLFQMLNELECLTSQEAKVEKESFVSQSSVFVECGSLEILVSRETISESIRSSMQSELPGLWHRLKLKVQNLELLSVTNTGGIRGAGFFRLTHGEGKLWGFSSGVPDHEFLLVTCNNSTIKRGDGAGSNALSSRRAGSDIIHLSDPEISHNSTSVTVSCGTIVAVGGRLDWFNAISSFFHLPSLDTEEVGDNAVLNKEVNDGSCKTSFVLNLIDIALSYEPYMMNPVLKNEVKDSESGYSYTNDDIREQCVACLLAASSLILSTTALGESVENSYQIKVQDLGLLLHAVSGMTSLRGIYSVEHLQKTGYVKVAQEAFMEANFKTNCGSGNLWELELSNSHIYVETCHDTTASLIRLASQLQQLFAPDVEESIVHLQNRWENVQRAQQRNDFCYETRNLGRDDVAASSQQCPLKASLDGGSRMAGLMEEICDDAFQVNDNNTQQPCSSGSGICMPLDGIFVDDISKMSMEEPEVLSPEGSLSESVPVVGPEVSHTSILQEGWFPDIIEEYYFSDLCPLPEISVGIHSDEVYRYKLSNVESREIERGSGGWYKGSSPKVLENHISEESEHSGLKKSADGILLSNDSSLMNEACGRVILKKIDLRWKMYGGSDWLASRENEQYSGRDTTACLELALSGIKFQYDIFPDGGISISKMSLSVQDFNLYDRSRDAPWKLVKSVYLVAFSI